MDKKFNWISTILLVILFSNCSLYGQSENFDYGSVTENIYTNDYFKCKIEIPENWVVQSRERTDQIADLGKELIAGDNQKLKSVIKVSNVNTVNLLCAFQHELGYTVDYNPNIIVVAENVIRYPEIKSGRDFLFQSKRLMKQSQFKYDYVSDEFERIKISGVEFYKMEAHMNIMGTEVKQMFYSTIRERFSFNIVISYVTESQKEILLESLDSLKFNAVK
ncbi:hypothetical protein [Flammeovirga aprica]|uniref:Uncharacterized protein n=1 Tax=Flammeovirga aprica JL-4 TaxID=694437 RepID=A0A7X9RZL6_9BACT|nr:hypothetical protein [Flammeovirga aprica]NME71600.1 hypothetical protein [Flammeovirga aprica JL-4]